MIRLSCFVVALSFIGAPALGCAASWMDCGSSACYHFHMCYKPFIEARAICNSSGSKLASIETLQERTYLAQAIKTGVSAHGTFDNNFLVGGVRSTNTDDFNWLDGSTFIFQSEISMSNNDLCLKFQGLPDDVITAAACNSYNQFLCKNGSASPLPESSLLVNFTTSEVLPSPSPHELFTSESLLNLQLSSVFDALFHNSLSTRSVLDSQLVSSSTSSSRTIVPTGIWSNLQTQISVATTPSSFAIESPEISFSYDPALFQNMDESVPSGDMSDVAASMSYYIQPTSSMGVYSEFPPSSIITALSSESFVTADNAVQPTPPFAEDTSVPTVPSDPSVYPYTTSSCVCGCKGTLLYSLNDTNPEVLQFLNNKFKKKKLTTADDPRPSARGIGGGAVVLLVVGFLAIVVMDASKLVQDISQMFDNIRGKESRSRIKKKRRT